MKRETKLVAAKNLNVTAELDVKPLSCLRCVFGAVGPYRSWVEIPCVIARAVAGTAEEVSAPLSNGGLLSREQVRESLLDRWMVCVAQHCARCIPRPE